MNTKYYIEEEILVKFWIKQLIIAIGYIGILILFMLTFSTEANRILTPILTTVFVWVMNNIVSKDYQNKLSKELKAFEISLRVREFKDKEKLENYKKATEMLNLLEKELVDTFLERTHLDPRYKEDDIKKVSLLKEKLEKAKGDIIFLKGFIKDEVYSKIENITTEMHEISNDYECYLTGIPEYFSEMSEEEYDKIMSAYCEMASAIRDGKMAEPIPQLNENYKTGIEKIKENIADVRKNINRLTDAMAKS